MTVSRRVILQAGAAVAAGPLVLPELKVESNGPTQRISAVVTDASSIDARLFAEAATGHGLEVHTAGDDLADLYCDHLEPRWRRGEATAGLTGVASLFHLERLAWDAGLRIVFLGRHPLVDAGKSVHAVTGPGSVVDTFHASVRMLDWRVALARTLTQVPVGAPALRPLSAVRDAMIARDAALYSWVLAPHSLSRIGGTVTPHSLSRSSGRGLG